MQKLFMIGLVLFATIGLGYAEIIVRDDFMSLGSWRPAHGSWQAVGGRLNQTDTAAALARIDRPLPQSGVVDISFDVMYLDGGYKSIEETLKGRYHGGFGIHIGVERPFPRRSWGNGHSYLLWLNLDTTVATGSPHFGFRAQVYESRSATVMNVMDDYNVEILPVAEALEYLSYLPGETFRLRFVVNTDTGEVRAYDPTLADYYYYFHLDPAVLRGSHISLRTNRLGMSFSNFRVERVR